MVNCTGRNIPPYAILSHTWMGDDEEVSYEDWTAGIAESKAGYAKIRSCAEQATRDGFEYIWADTCCIQKSSSAELSEAINSMFAWYQDAAICYAFLADVPSKQGFSGSKYFTRGWTLQELIAPGTLVFFDEAWTSLGSKNDLQYIVSDCTGIPASILSGDEDFEAFSIAQRMSWAARRVTTRVEDMSYCMLGLFDINMPLIYGEGENAFMRLQEEILKISEDHSLFAWRSPDNRGGCLATSPIAFSDCGNVVQSNSFRDQNEPTIVSSSGIYLDLPFKALCSGRLGFAILNCVDMGQGNKQIAICLRDLTLTMRRFERVCSHEIEVLDLHKLRTPQISTRKLCIQKGRVRRNLTPRPSVAGPLNMPSFNERPVAGSLIEAIAKHRDDEAWFFISRKELDVGAIDGRQMGALHHAATTGNDRILAMLLGRHDIQLGAEIIKRELGPFLVAAGRGYEPAVKVQLDTGGIDLDPRNRDGRTPLSLAAENGHEAVTKLLLDTGRVDVNSADKMSLTPLIWAARSGRYKVVALLLTHVDISIDKPDTYGRTAFSWAMQYGHEAVVCLLLETKRVNVNARERSGWTPLKWAALNKHTSLIRLVVSTGRVGKIPKTAQRLLDESIHS